RALRRPMPRHSRSGPRPSVQPLAELDADVLEPEALVEASRRLAWVEAHLLATPGASFVHGGTHQRRSCFLASGGLIDNELLALRVGGLEADRQIAREGDDAVHDIVLDRHQHGAPLAIEHAAQ